MAAESFPAGDFVVDEMVARGWNMDEMERRSGLTLERIRAILGGSLTEQDARGLEAAFDMSAEFWMNLHREYCEYREATDGRSRDKTVVG